MASSVIGALRVNLGIDSAAFSDGLKKAQTGLDRFAKQATVAFAAVTAAGTAMAGALAIGIKKTIDEADDMGKAAQKFGVAVDELSRLKHAADLSGVSFEGLGTSLRKISQNIQEFANGGKNAASEAFQALGISVKNADGTLKSSSQVLTDVAAKFKLMEDGAQKTALAIALFGRSGADLIPLLNAGADGLREMMQEADTLGIVIDTKTARAAEAFNDNLTRLEQAKNGVITKITAALLPALELLSEKFLAVAKDGEAIETMASGLTAALAFIANEVAQLAILASRLSAELAGIGEAFSRLGSGDFSGAWAAFQAGQEKSAQMAADLKAQVEGIFSGENISQGGIQRRIDDAFGTAGVAASEKFVANFAESASSSGKKIKEKLDPIFREAARVYDATRTPLENYQMQIGRLNAMLDAGAISQDTYNRAVIQAQDAFDKAENAGKSTESVFKSIGQSISSSFASAFQGLIDGSKRVGDVLKDLLSQLASLALNQVFTSLVGGLFGGLGLPGFAAGTNDAPRGFAVVGERGPEIVHFGGGESVIPNNEIGGGGRSVVEIRMSPDVEARVLQQAGNQSVQIVQAAAPGIVKGSVSAVQQTSRNKPGFFR